MNTHFLVTTRVHFHGYTQEYGFDGGLGPEVNVTNDTSHLRRCVRC